MAEIDRLELQVEAEAAKANQQLDKLVKNLNKVVDALGLANADGIGNLADGVNKLSSAMKSMSGVKTSQFSTLAKNIKKITDVDEKKMYKTANALRNISNTVSGFNGSGVKVSVNNSDVNRQAERIRTTTEQTAKIIDDLSAKFANVGKDLRFTGTNNQLSNEILKAEKYFDSLLEKEEKFNLTSGNKNTSTYTNMQYEIAKTANWLDILYNKEKQISNVDPFSNLTITHFQFPNQIFQGFEEFGKAVKEAKEEATSLDETLFKSTNSFKEIAATAANGGEQAKSSIRSVEVQTSAMQNTLNLMRSSFDLLFGSIKNGLGRIKSGFSSFKSIGNINPMGAKVSSEAYKELATNIAKAEKNLFNLYEKQDKMQATGVKESSRSWKTLQYDIKNAEEQLERYQKSMSRLKASGKDVTFTPIKFSSLLKNIPSIKSGTSSLIPKFKGLTSESKKLDLASLSLTKGLFKVGRMMKYMLLYKGLSSIINGTKEGFQNLSKYSSETNASLSMLMSSLTQLKNSFAAAFAPILSVVAPILNKLIQMLITAANAIGQFFAALTGKSVYVRAKKVNQDYAAGLEDTADSAKDAEKAIKDASTSIDELNVIQDSSDSKDKGKGSGKPNELSPGDMFETVEIDSKFKNLADTVKEIFGKIAEAAEPTRIALEKLWNEGFKEFANFSYDALLGFLNHFLIPVGFWMLNDDSGLPRFFNITNDLLKEINWDKLLNSLNDFWTALQKPTKFVWNSLMDFYEYFLKPLAVWTMGEGLPKFLEITTKLINNIDWDKLNSALRNFWKALAPFAESIGRGLLRFYEDLAKIGAPFINTVVPGGLNGIANALDNMNPRDIENIAYALTALYTALALYKGVSTIAGLFTKLGKGILTLSGLSGMTLTIPNIALALTKIGSVTIGAPGFDMIGSAIMDGLWGAVKDLIPDWVGKLIGGIGAGFVGGAVLGSWVPGIGTLIGGIVGAIVGALASIDIDGKSILHHILDPIFNWDATLSIWEDAKSNFKKGGLYIIAGVFEGILAAIGFILEPIGDFFVAIFKGFCAIFGIHSPAKEMEPIGKFIVLGILEGLKNTWTEFTTFLSGLPQKAIDAFGNIKNKFLAKGNDIINGIKEGWNNLAGGFSTWLSQKRESVVTSFGSYWNNFVNKGKDIINGIKEGWNNLAGGFTTWLGQKRENVVSWFGSFLNNFVAKGKEIITGIQKGWNDLSGSFTTWLGQRRDNVVSWFGDLKSKFVSKGSDIISGIKKGWNDNWSSFSSWLNGLPGKIISPFSNIYNEGKKIIKNFIDGLKSVKLPTFHIDWGSTSKSFFGTDISIPIPKISFYKDGGFPNVGEAFIARENGPEMVGRIGNKSAVANNDQITTSITNAVIRGMQGTGSSSASDALLREQNELLRRILEKDTNVNINGRKLNEELDSVKKSNGFNFAT